MAFIFYTLSNKEVLGMNLGIILILIGVAIIVIDAKGKD
jgi:membrane-bound ClpP family serine protease